MGDSTNRPKVMLSGEAGRIRHIRPIHSYTEPRSCKPQSRHLRPMSASSSSPAILNPALYGRPQKVGDLGRV